ncbi:regulator of chromosome condensation 1/beta-lactamase-inhibitor protein II [Podospora australis]|uniref:Regulator of chromosome condensation 1/beta-lactamase-inhibitor protein II n=1 Tax=Podospora australis TaxID=1536484 RepID=A0AAN7ALC2_9PEZI|nr:regulator of chromosome condensation 1/beta-lactamase-inhibitor protein II [Podospora australis]
MDTDLDLNPKEARPGEVTFFEGVGDGKGGGNGGQKKEIRVRDIAAGDSATWVVTEDRGVWGWGTMRSSEGTTRFHPLTTLQSFPTPISSIPEPIIRIVAGCNHVLCLSQKGNVYTWGAGCEQGQLGRRVVERSRLSHVLTPRKIGLKSIADIGTGSDHSFAISSDGKVYAWGLNNFGQTGVVPSSKRNTIGGTKAGEDSACVMLPSLVEGLAGKKVVKITGGNKHSLALTETGEVYSWGMVDGFATGHRLADFTEGDERVVRDERGRPRILKVPTKIRGALEGKKVISVTAGGEHSLVVTSEGKAYGWGFNNSHQTGQRGDDDVEVPMLVDYKAVRGKRFVWAGAGGQFSLLGEEVLD